MTGIELIIAIAAIVISLGSLSISIWAIRVSKSQAATQKVQAQKHTIIDLHSAWKDIHMLDPLNPITPQAMDALSAMQLATSMWTNDIGSKMVIRQHMANDFIALYDAFKICEIDLPGTKKTGKSFLTHEMGIVYGELKNLGE
ncbi:hypothetical protein QX776_09645 [Alteromonadaceae bacterium BrNp21-10]|nr:hypothetical protein [Alteromonadaceae bacterium BrNp21-10]